MVCQPQANVTRLTPILPARIQCLLFADPTNSVVQTEVGTVTNITRKSVGLPTSTYQQIEHLARTNGLSGSAIIRRAVDDYIQRCDPSAKPQNGDGDIAASISRIALTTEFTQATVDILLRDRSPSDRDEVLLTVQQRMKKIHGKK
jgi:metal-responsive CopG/Arc/MetJ family transcriptional regulator